MSLMAFIGFGTLCVLWLCLIVQQLDAAANYQQLYDGIAQVSADVQFKGIKYFQNAGSAGFAYSGIKYGVSERFKASVENKNFSYLHDPSYPKEGFICPQLSFTFPGFPPRNLIQNEDCLFLDVYLPPVSKDQTKLFPVMLWIHGGGFAIGDKNMYNSTILAPAVDAIIVTVNYRLFAFGFLSTGDEVSQGNYALDDITLALKWVEDNIGKFGGDANKITIFGESAGGVLASAMLLSDKVRENVKSVVGMSGSIFMPYAVIKQPMAKYFAVKLATAVGCPVDSSANIVACLKNIPFIKIINSSKGLTDQDPTTAIRFAPVADGHHIPVALKDYITKSSLPASGKSANLITGYLKDDASFLLYLISPQFFSPHAALNYTFIKTILAGQILVFFANCPEQCGPGAQKILQFYNITEADDHAVLLKKLIQIHTDSMFAYPSIKEAAIYANRSFSSQIPNQKYLISYDPGFRGMGAFHGMELVHIFRGHMALIMGNHTISETVSNSLHEFLRDIAHNGKTNSPAFGNQQNFQNLNQEGKWENSSRDFAETLRFWDSLSELPCETANQGPTGPKYTRISI